MLPSRVLVPAAAGAVAVVVVAVVLVMRGGDGPSARTTLSVVEPSATAEGAPTPAPTPSDSPSPLDVPTAEPQGEATTPPAQGETSMVPAPTSSAVPADRGLPPGSPPCSGFVYPGETGANPGGPDDVHAALLAPHTIGVSWETHDVASSHVQHFFVTLVDPDCTQINKSQELPPSARSAQIDDVPNGRWMVVVREQNDAGVNGGCSTQLTVGATPTPTSESEPTPALSGTSRQS